MSDMRKLLYDPVAEVRMWTAVELGCSVPVQAVPILLDRLHREVAVDAGLVGAVAVVGKFLRIDIDVEDEILLETACAIVGSVGFVGE